MFFGVGRVLLRENSAQPDRARVDLDYRVPLVLEVGDGLGSERLLETRQRRVVRRCQFEWNAVLCELAQRRACRRQVLDAPCAILSKSEQAAYSACCPWWCCVS